MHQGRAGDAPAVAGVAHQIGGWNASIGEEHLVERRVAVHLEDRANLHTRLLHRQDEVADALVLGDVPVGAGEQHAVIGVVGARVPHLLAVDDPVVAVTDSGRAQPGEVGTGAGLAEQLGPRDLAGDRRTQDRERSSSEPCVTIVGAASDMPAPSGVPTAPKRRISSATILSAHAGSPRPCHSTGHDGTAQPASCEQPPPLHEVAFGVPVRVQPPLHLGPELRLVGLCLGHEPDRTQPVFRGRVRKDRLATVSGHVGCRGRMVGRVRRAVLIR